MAARKFLYPHSTEKRMARQTSCNRDVLKLVTRRTSLSCEIVTRLCRLTAHGPFTPSSTSNRTSDGTSRIVEVMGAMVTVARCPIALLRVKISTGRCLSGGGNLQRNTSPRLRFRATMPYPPKHEIPLPFVAWPRSRACLGLPVQAHAIALSGCVTPHGSRLTGLLSAAGPLDRRHAVAFHRVELESFPYVDLYPQYIPR